VDVPELVAIEDDRGGAAGGGWVLMPGHVATLSSTESLCKTVVMGVSLGVAR